MMVATLDKFGRVIIPKKLRDQLGITPETTLNIEEDGKRIIIEPMQQEDSVIEKEGILVFTGKLQGETARFLVEDRQDRMHKLLAGDK